MKKRWTGIILGIMLLIPLIWGGTESKGKSSYTPAAETKAIVLLDLNTGEILMSRNGNELLPLGSMTKLMTELIVLEDIKAGRRHWNETVKISDFSSRTEGIRLPLYEGEELTVRELFESMAVYSANDAAVAIAEHFSGTEDKFVERMNRKARELGLSSKAVFVNASGLEKRGGEIRSKGIHSENRMTAHDTAKLTMYLLTNHPELLEISSRTQVKLQGRALYLSSTNRMLPELAGPFSYEGLDGLKAGFSEGSGFSFTGTAERDGTRLVAVVLGTKKSEARFDEARRLFDYGFSAKQTAESS